MATVEPAVKLLVQPNGQLVPPSGLEQTVGKPNWSFKPDPPAEKFDCAALRERTSHVFEIKEIPISASQFEDGFNAILAKYRAMAQLAGLDKNIILPCLLPSISEGDDIGLILCETFVPAVKRGYALDFPERTFYPPDNLSKCVSLTPNTGHERFLKPNAGFTIYGCVIDCMRAWPARTQRQPRKELIDLGISVTGGYDGLAMLAEHTKVLGSRFNNPAFDMSGVQVDKGDWSLCALAFGGSLSLRVGGGLVRAYGDCSGGVSLLG